MISSLRAVSAAGSNSVDKLPGLCSAVQCGHYKYDTTLKDGNILSSEQEGATNWFLKTG